MTAKLKRMGSVFGSALKDRGGGIAPMFGVMFALVIVPIVGVGLDLGRAVTSRTDLQDALDATALALSKMPLNTSQADLQTAANKWMAANLGDRNLSTPVITVQATYATSTNPTNSINLTAASQVSTTIGAVTGIGQLPLSVKSATYWGMQHIELALVLDNTGSMMESDASGSTKSATLKNAANTLIDTLSAQAQASGDPLAFKVGMVPFATYVNVGAANKGAWITGTSPYANDIFTSPTDRFALFTKLTAKGGAAYAWGGCVESRPMPYDIQDTAPSNGNTMFVPYFAPDEPDDTYTSGSTKYDVYYNNYLSDATSATDFTTKQGNPGKYSGTPDSTRTSLYGNFTNNGPNKDCPSVPLIRLTTDYSSVKTAINALAPAGNTHIPFGLVWGWHLISPNTPFADGVAYGTKNVVKVVVLVTDGNNTYFAGSANPATNAFGGSSGIDNEMATSKGAWTGAWNVTNNSIYTGYGYVWEKRIAQDGGSTADPALAMDDRLVKLCANMKSAGITMYTVPLLVTDANTKSMLQGCASSSSNYLEAQSGDQLKAAFQTIATSISQLRISH